MAVQVHTRTRLEIVESADTLGDRPLLTPDTENAPHPTGAMSAVPAISQLAIGEIATANAEYPHTAEIPTNTSNQAIIERQIGIDDFDAVFTRFQTPLANFVYRMVSNREEAYDIVQDVFIKIYRAFADGTTIAEGALTSWAYRIAVNTATDALRRRRHITWVPLSVFSEDRGIGAGLPADDRTSTVDFSHDHSAPPDGSFLAGNGGMFEDRVANIEIVQTVLSRMPPKYSRCLLLYEHEGFTCAEISEMLGLSPSAVKMRLMRARERFISLYQGVMNDEVGAPARSRVNTLAGYVRDILKEHNVAVMSGRRKNALGQAAAEVAL